MLKCIRVGLFATNSTAQPGGQNDRLPGDGTTSHQEHAEDHSPFHLPGLRKGMRRSVATKGGRSSFAGSGKPARIGFGRQAAVSLR